MTDLEESDNTKLTCNRSEVVDELTIASIVASGKFDREFELGALENDLNVYSCTYSKEEHPGLHMKFYEDGPTTTIFRSGSCNIRGASSIEELYENRSLIERTLSDLGVKEEISGFRITNIVFTADLGYKVDLNELSIRLGLENIEYEPEQFPGLVYRLDSGVILIFTSGKLVLTGFTSIEIARQAFNELSAELTDD